MWFVFKDLINYKNLYSYACSEGKTLLSVDRNITQQGNVNLSLHCL